MESIETSDYIFKVIILGEASVGKTSITLRYATNRFDEDYRMTLGLNLSNKDIHLERNGENLIVSLSLWDTGGQIAFAPLLPMYYKGALGAMIVYDITKRKSYDRVIYWIEDLKKHCDEIPLVIIGNKRDLDDKREVSEEEGKKIRDEVAERWSSKVFFFETSAKEDVQINESFTTLAMTILDKVETEEDVDEPDFG